ncbi:MAG: hypothetical protein ACRC1H_00450, partial [Caldilineaceae bacterium]
LALGQVYLLMADLEVARRHLEKAVALFEGAAGAAAAPGRATDLMVCTQTMLAWVLWALGLPEQALVLSSRALERAQMLDAPATWDFALAVAGALFALLRADAASAQPYATALLGRTQDKAFSPYRPLGLLVEGLGKVEQGLWADGLAQMRSALALWQAAGVTLGSIVVMLAWVRALRRANANEEALGVVEEALLVVEQTGLRFGEPELWRHKGELLLARGSAPAHAEQCLETAVTLAQARLARGWELRATVSLCRLWQAQGRPHDAWTRLSALYGQFGEGLGTPDLQAARSLLNDLAAENQLRLS